MKAIELVKKVSALGAAALRRDHKRPLAMRATVQLLRMTTVVAREMQRFPAPAPRPAERVMLSAAAAQLRAMRGSLPITEAAASDPDSPEVALADLVAETLSLVDRVLEMAPELPREQASKVLAEPTPERGAGADPEREPTVTKVSF